MVCGLYTLSLTLLLVTIFPAASKMSSTVANNNYIDTCHEFPRGARQLPQKHFTAETRKSPLHARHSRVSTGNIVVQIVQLYSLSLNSVNQSVPDL